MIDFTSKLPELKTTIFTTMGQLALKYNAVNLSQGFPNFGTDPRLLELVNSAMNDGHNQYAPMQGDHLLRKKVSDKIALLHGKEYSAENEITITAGATQAIFTAIATFIRHQDEVIVFKPAYDCYEPAIKLYGGKVIPLPLSPSNFKVDWEVFKNKIGPKTKMVIINSPHNPSGTVLSKADMLQLQEAIKGTDIILLSDEVYEHIVFDELKHESVSRFADLAKRSLICSSFGKTFHVTGWKLGYIVGPEKLMKEFQKIHQYNVFCVNHPVQKALAEYLENEEHYLALNAFYQEKRDYFLDSIASSRFQYEPSKGTYFQILDYSGISDESDMDFSKRLIQEHQIASIPLSVFNLNHADHKQLRFCFAKTEETLKRAADILNAI